MGKYWYVSAYAGLFVLIPFLNGGINSLSEEKAKVYMGLLFCVFTVIPTLARHDTFLANSGYSTFWLAYLYVIGACLKKYGWGAEMQPGKAVGMYICCVLLSWGIKMGCEGITAYLLGEPKTGFSFIAYTSPTMVAAAVFLFFAFKNCSVPPKMIGWISSVSPAAFGVYLIHEHEYISGHFIADRFTGLAQFSTPVMIICVLGAAATIFGGCLLIDWIRHKLFTWLHVKEALERLENKYIHYNISV